MRPLYASTITVTRSGKALIVTFENTSSMTSARINKSAARGLIQNLEAKLALPDKPQNKPGAGR